MPASPAIRTTARALLLAAAVFGCGSGAELRAARRSGYKADFALVFNQVVAAVRSRFKHFPEMVDENAAAGTIETAWLSVKQTSGTEDHKSSQQQRDVAAAEEAAKGNSPTLGTSGQERTIYLIRYQVYVVGGDPWRVVVRGRAAKRTEGDAMHVELKGADAPAWLAGRIETLEVDIYRRLQRYAVPLVVAAADDDDRPPPVPADLARYGKIPRPAAERVEEVRRAAADRDFARLRTSMVEDFEWNLGTEPDADQAIAMWQADGGALGALIEVLEGGCRAESDTRVTCPPEFSEQVGYLGWRAAFERRGDAWHMTLFLRGD